MSEDSTEITTLEEALREIEKLRRTVGRLTRDNRVLVRLRENAEHIRTVFEKEKSSSSSSTICFSTIPPT
ncbi:MAG: hypothetical protein LUE17_09810 [Planctomycetaceae bacterium]|nr:hypothetical protein [Planctomycetaceae bacterium]